MKDKRLILKHLLYGNVSPTLAVEALSVGQLRNYAFAILSNGLYYLGGRYGLSEGEVQAALKGKFASITKIIPSNNPIATSEKDVEI